MKVKFTNPTDKTVYFSHGNLDGGRIFFVEIGPNSHSIYEMSDQNLTRWRASFKNMIAEWDISVSVEE